MVNIHVALTVSTSWRPETDLSMLSLQWAAVARAVICSTSFPIVLFLVTASPFLQEISPVLQANLVGLTKQ